MIFFSIIATDFDKTVSKDTLQRFIDSLKSQTFKDFEVLIMHDGRRTIDISDLDLGELNIRFLESVFRGNVWGHNLRSFGMSKAQGLYFINTNTDNIYYPDALQELFLECSTYTDCKVFINKVRMMGLYYIDEEFILKDGEILVRKTLKYDHPRDYNKSIILDGNPPVFANIDLMNIIAHKDIWESIHYWYDLGVSSDAIIYSRICSLYQYRHTNILLGEHY